MLMAQYECMRLPQDIINEYQIMDKVKNIFIMCEIIWGLYQLPQAGMITNKIITKRPKNNGYHPCELTPVLQKHEMIPVIFFLTVNNFGVKYVVK